VHGHSGGALRRDSGRPERRQSAHVPPDICTYWDAPAGSRLVHILEDFSAWPELAAYRVESLGIHTLAPSRGDPLVGYRHPDGGVIAVRLLAQWVAVRGCTPIGFIRWVDGRTPVSSIQDIDQAQDDATVLRVNRAIRTVVGIRRKRGPKLGTVKSQKYKTPEEWHAAIREKVLTKPIKTKVKTQIAEIAASRLDISTSTMRRLQRKWLSQALEDVLNGKH
jgi:hypothetical protein